MTLAKKRGDAAQLYANSGSFGSPTPVALRITDLHWVDKPGKLFDASDRTIDVDTFIATRSTWTIEFEIINDSGDANIVAMIAAARMKANYEMIVTDDAIASSGSKGLHAEWACESGFDNDAKLADGQKCKMKWVPAGNYTNAPVRWQTA